MTTRRLVLSRSAAMIGAASTSMLLPEIVRAQSNKVRIGLMLPYTGTFAPLGVAIENSFRMAIDEQGGKLAGREIEWFKVDDESEPSKGVENASRLVQRDKVDVLLGTVHSGVQMGIHRVARESGVLNLIPNAGVHAATRALCAPNVFRTSFSNSQPTRALGKPMVDKGLKKAVWITWKYAAGEEAFEGFKEGYLAAGGTIVKELGLPFPNVEFQALLTEIAALKPDAVACFFAGGGAAKFIKDYAAAGLKELTDRLAKDSSLRVQLMSYASDAEKNVSRSRRLSLERAVGVRKMLLDNGIDSTRIEVRALGDQNAGGAPDRVDIVVSSRR